MQRPGTKTEKLHVADLPNDARFTNDKTPPPAGGRSRAGPEDDVSSDVALDELDDDFDESSLSLSSDVDLLD